MNDGVNDEIETNEQAGQDSVPDEVSEKFDEIFGKADAEDLAEAGVENTEVPAVSDKVRIQRRNAEREQQDELIEEGLVDPENPDGSLEKPEATDETEDGSAPAGDKPAVEDAPEVDPHLRLAANELGWSDEKIDALVKKDPEVAQDVLNQLADTYTNLSRQFLTQGGPALIPPAQLQVEKPAQPDAPTSELDAIYANLEAFAESNGEDIAKFAKALKSEIIEPVKQLLAANRVAEERIRKTEAQTTLKTLRTKFADFYGSDDKAPSDVQKNNVATLAQIADQLRAGASIQGRELSISDALNRAHLIATAEYRRQAVRKEIKEQVQKRTKSITAKPTQRQNPVAMAARSDSKAQEAYLRKAAELGIEV